LVALDTALEVPEVALIIQDRLIPCVKLIRLDRSGKSQHDIMRGTLLMAVLLVWGTAAASTQQGSSRVAVGPDADEFFRSNGINLW
jgi:hypothetical protein